MFKFYLINNSVVSSNAEGVNLGTAPSGNHLLHVRPAPMHALNQIILDAGHTSNVFDYFSHWNKDTLADLIVNDSQEHGIILLFSFTLNNKTHNRESIFNFISNIKNKKQKVYTVAGGIKPHDAHSGNYNFLDVVYTGRSMNLFAQDVKQGALFDKLDQLNKPVTIVPSTEQYDLPIVHHYHADSCWGDSDIGSFEIAMGCKFDCSFCSYDLRGIKNPKVQQIDTLVSYFSQAKEHGVTHFFAGDDTINEDDVKLENLREAIKQLDYTPHIAAFVRQDIVHNKPHRVELLRDAGIRSMFFGIESMNYDANRLIRKGATAEKIVSNLKQIKDINPDSFLFGAFMVGLTNDSESVIWENNDLVAPYLDGLYYSALYIQKNNPDWDWTSDIDKNPEQFGYTVTERAPGSQYVTWHNNWTTEQAASALSARLNEHNERTYGMHKLMSNWLFTAAHALGKTAGPATWKNDFMMHYGFKRGHLYKSNTPNDVAMKNYIERKIALYRGAN